MQALILGKQRQCYYWLLAFQWLKTEESEFKTPEHQPLYREQIKSLTTPESSQPAHLINQIFKIHTLMVFSYSGPSMHSGTTFKKIFQKTSAYQCYKLPNSILLGLVSEKLCEKINPSVLFHIPQVCQDMLNMSPNKIKTLKYSHRQL